MVLADLYNRLDQIIARLGPPPADREVHYINYAHRIGDVLYHGTISDLDGVARATWTYEEDGKLVTRNNTLEREALDGLWTAMWAIPVFAQTVAGDMGLPISPITHHIVSLIFKVNGQLERCICLIPAGEADPAFANWLVMLTRPDLVSKPGT